MQNSFVGDIGDFGKYALLNALTGGALRLGVNWYLNAGATKSGDGKFTDYRQLRSCDPVLHDALKAIVQNDRSIAAVERSGILPLNTIFFPLPVSRPRAVWNDRALEALSGTELVFMDPDKGFGPAGPEYIVPEEVSAYLHRGQSVIVYQHQTRDKGGLDVTIPKTFTLLESLGCETKPWAFVFRRRQARVYFIVPAPAHVETLLQRSLSFLKTVWVRDKHFELWGPDKPLS